MIRRTAVLLAGALALAGAGCGGSSGGGGGGGADPAAAAARSLYQTRCSTCHGASGAGDGAAAGALIAKPRSFSEPAWQRSVSDEHLEKVIVRGGTAVELSPLMPANPDLEQRPDLVRELILLVRSFEQPAG